MKLRIAGLTVICIAALAGQARAQVVWDSPMLMAPRPAVGTGLYLIDAHRAGVGILGTMRQSPQGVGLRLGIVDGRGDGIGILGGVDVSGLLATVSPDFPFDVSWVAGIGAGFDDWLVISAPLGLSLGRTFTTPDATLTPYITPRLMLDANLGRDPPARNELRLAFALDLGFDVAFQPGWMIRFGAGLGDRGGLAIGLVF